MWLDEYVTSGSLLSINTENSLLRSGSILFPDVAELFADLAEVTW